MPGDTAAALLHTLPDGSSHVDLLVSLKQAVSPEERCLAAFRLDRPPWEIRPGETACATRLPPHRARYLAYEGPISRNRGAVRRLDAALVTALRRSEDALDCRLAWRAHGRQPLRCDRVAQERWRICVPAP